MWPRLCPHFFVSQCLLLVDWLLIFLIWYFVTLWAGWQMCWHTFSSVGWLLVAWHLTLHCWIVLRKSLRWQKGSILPITALPRLLHANAIGKLGSKSSPAWWHTGGFRSSTRDRYGWICPRCPTSSIILNQFHACCLHVLYTLFSCFLLEAEVFSPFFSYLSRHRNRLDVLFFAFSMDLNFASFRPVCVGKFPFEPLETCRMVLCQCRCINTTNPWPCNRLTAASNREPSVRARFAVGVACIFLRISTCAKQRSFASREVIRSAVPSFILQPREPLWWPLPFFHIKDL